MNETLVPKSSASEDRVLDFDENFERLWRHAYRVAYRLLRQSADAEDVAQDTLVRVAVDWPKVATYADAFAARVAGQRAIDVWRRNQRRSRTQWKSLSVADGGPAERDDLVRALLELPRRQREVLVLRYVADLSGPQTATALGCSEGTIRQHASRGLATLRGRLPRSAEEE
jgi:DNA-directed RNA polymerase specialized sigma24 family protein